MHIKIQRDSKTGALLILPESFEEAVIRVLSIEEDAPPSREDALEHLLQCTLEKLREANAVANSLDLQNFKLRNANRALASMLRSLRKPKRSTGGNHEKTFIVPF